MVTEEMKELISKYGLEHAYGAGGVPALKITNKAAAKSMTSEGRNYLSANKMEIFDYLVEQAKIRRAAREAQEEEDEKHKTTFVVVGFCNAHEVTIDDRKPLKAQFENLASRYENDLVKPEMVKEAYNKAIQKEAEEEEEEKITLENIAAVEKKAAETGENQVLTTYMAECNDPEEDCSYDRVTIYITPEGKQITKRTHTW